jgi:cell division protein FtsQ
MIRYALLFCGVAFALYRGGSLAARARWLQVDRIVVRGNERLDGGEVHGVLNGLRGESLIWTDLEGWRRRLLASPWVLDATLRRTLPSTIEVDLLERQPVAAGRLNGQLYLIDEEGVVIDHLGPQHVELDLPIVDGLAPGRRDGAPASGIDPARAALAARLLAAVAADQEIARRISQIDVSDLHNASVILTGDSAVAFVGEERFLERLRAYLALSSALRERIADIDYVDLRFEDRMYVKPRSPGSQVVRR